MAFSPKFMFLFAPHAFILDPLASHAFRGGEDKISWHSFSQNLSYYQASTVHSLSSKYRVATKAD